MSSIQPAMGDSLENDDYVFVSYPELPSSTKPSEVKKTNFVAEVIFCDKCNSLNMEPSTAYDLFSLEAARDSSGKSLGAWLVYPKESSSIWSTLWRPDYYPLEDKWISSVSFNKKGKPIVTKKEQHRCSPS